MKDTVRSSTCRCIFKRRLLRAIVVYRATVGWCCSLVVADKYWLVAAAHRYYLFLLIRNCFSFTLYTDLSPASPTLSFSLLLPLYSPETVANNEKKKITQKQTDFFSYIDFCESRKYRLYKCSASLFHLMDMCDITSRFRLQAAFVE